MSDQYHWKKIAERQDLDSFLGAYEEATGRSISPVEGRETPDFICHRENGERLGLELTKIIEPPDTRRWHRLFGAGPIQCSSDIAEAAYRAAAQKAEKLRRGGWKTSETILVIQLFDNPLSETHRGLEQIDRDDFTETGFAEIWISDHSTLDAFGRVDLFGLYPEQLGGYYALTAGCKPYG